MPVGGRGRLFVKLAIGLLVVGLIAWNLDFRDQVVLADGRLIKGGQLRIASDAVVVANGVRFPFADTVVTRVPTGLSVKTRGQDSVLTPQVSFEGGVTIVEVSRSMPTAFDLRQLRQTDAGTKPIRVIGF